MRIPEHSYFNQTPTCRLWDATAEQMSLETGIFILVEYEYYESVGLMDPRIKRIFFKVGEHEFESLAELKTAINNRAFL
jgi:hypothetical protein